MRILIGADVFPDPHGGVAQVLYNLQEQLLRKGIHVDLLFLDSVPGWLRALLPSRITFPFLLAIHTIKERKRYDAVQGQGSNGWIYGVLRRIFRNLLPPYILMSFELENLVWQAQKKEALLKRTRISLKTRLVYPLTKLLPLQVALRTADHLIISNHDLDYVKPRFGRYTVQYNGVPAYFFINHERRDNKPVGVMFNLTWHWRKGIADLPDIFSKILACNDAHITLVTPQPPPFVMRMKEKYPDRFQVYSNVHTDELISLYWGHSIFVDPSVNCAPPLLAVLEAMASRMAVVASGLPYMDKVIEHGYNGFLVTPRDVEGIVKKIGLLVHDAELRRLMGSRAQDTARGYEWSKNIQAYVSMYRMISLGQ